MREGRGKRLKETPGHVLRPDLERREKRRTRAWPTRFGGLDYVAREVIKAEDIVDYTQKENIAEKFARRFGAGAMSSLLEFAARNAFAIR